MELISCPRQYASWPFLLLRLGFDIMLSSSDCYVLGSASFTEEASWCRITEGVSSLKFEKPVTHTISHLDCTGIPGIARESHSIKLRIAAQLRAVTAHHIGHCTAIQGHASSQSTDNY